MSGIEDLPQINFIVSEPRTPEARAANIREALASGLPHFDDRRLKRLIIVASGPSAELFFTTPRAAETKILAVNGALRFLVARGVVPDYWACCDPKAEIADLLPAILPTKTVYLVASKCDQAVFDRLRGRDVRLWHLRDDPQVKSLRAVKVASTVTLCVMTLMRQVGYRDMQVFGWDGCFVNDQHHVGSQQGPSDDDRIDIVAGAEIVDGQPIGGRRFQTTKTWALEARDAVLQLHHVDYNVTIHGDGLIKAVTSR